jgi:hypothetical protein
VERSLKEVGWLCIFQYCREPGWGEFNGGCIPLLYRPKKNVGEFGRTFVAVGRSVIKRESHARKGKERRKTRNKV